MPARPSKAKDELAHCGLSVEKSKFYDRLREIFVCGPRCGNIWKAIKMQPYDTTSPISLTHSLFLSHNWWHYYQRKTNIHKIVRFSSTISRHARLARVSICFSSVKFVSIFSSFMRFLLKQWQRWWYGLRPDLFSPPSSLSVWVWYDINESLDRLHWFICTIYVYSHPIYVYFEYSFSVLLWFICSCSCTRCTPTDLSSSGGGIYEL